MACKFSYQFIDYNSVWMKVIFDIIIIQAVLVLVLVN